MSKTNKTKILLHEWMNFLKISNQINSKEVYYFKWLRDGSNLSCERNDNLLSYKFSQKTVHIKIVIL
jgi:hypothetical protein